MRHYDAHLKELSKTVPFSVLATEIREEYKRRIGFLPGFAVRR
jgi:hypothetical protein